MLKKVVAGTMMVGFIGILVFGAINRTLDQTEKTAQAQGQGAGQGRSSEELAQGQGFGRGRSEEDVEVRAGQGPGNGQGGTAGRQYPNYETAPEAWVTYSGSVLQVPEPGVELMIETDEGEQVQIGTGPMDLLAQGFALNVGDPVQVSGYWEENEFKAAQLTHTITGQTLALRDEFGRPAWAGQGRNAQSTERDSDRGQGRQGAIEDGGGTGLAQVDGWFELQGSVVYANSEELMVITADGQEIGISGRPWRFAQELGFLPEMDDNVTLIGFYEGVEFEVGLIENSTSGQTVSIRDENGRPMWAGRGRNGL